MRSEEEEEEEENYHYRKDIISIGQLGSQTDSINVNANFCPFGKGHSEFSVHLGVKAIQLG